MTYETPKLTELTAAIDSIQGSKTPLPVTDGTEHENIAAYEDWE